MKPIPVSEFSKHVERLHADRDKLFEMEYEVSKLYKTRYQNISTGPTVMRIEMTLYYLRIYRVSPSTLSPPTQWLKSLITN